MTRYLKEFVSRYQIDKGLLEGKIQCLLDVIQMRCVPIKYCNSHLVLTSLSRSPAPSTPPTTDISPSRSTPPTTDITIISDNENTSSKQRLEQRKPNISNTKHPKSCPGYQLTFPPSPRQFEHAPLYPKSLHRLRFLPAMSLIITLLQALRVFSMSLGGLRRRCCMLSSCLMNYRQKRGHVGMISQTRSSGCAESMDATLALSLQVKKICR
jgi:hypothetical protein